VRKYAEESPSFVLQTDQWSVFKKCWEIV